MIAGYFLLICTQKVEEFTAPVAGEYKLQCWGAAGNPYNGGGYSYGDISLKSNTLLYVCVGAKGNPFNGVTGGKGGYNGGGDGGNGFTSNSSNYSGGAGGGGATHVAFSSGLLKELEAVYEKKLILVAGGSGGSSFDYGGGVGGGLVGGRPFAPEVYDNNNKIMIKPIRYGDSANQSGGYKFGEGQQGKTKSRYGIRGAEGSCGGGGGLYGGFSPEEEGNGSNWAGGGGCGYVNTILTNAKTIAGDTKLPSPNGGTEETTGHSGDGACIITQVSF